MQGSQKNRADALQILLIEDNPGDARLFEELLGESPVEGTLRHESRLDAGLSALREDWPDVLVLDLGLPDSEGPGTVDAVAAAAPSVPIVVLTGQSDLEAALQAQGAGAAEYLQKEELTPALVGRTLRWAVQRSRMQAKLRQQDAWIRSLTESVSAGMFRAGPTGRIEFANEALLDMLGYEREELIGQDLTTLSAEPTQQGQMLADEGAEGTEMALRRKDGSVLVGLLSAEAVYDAKGEVLHYDGVISDITAQKRTLRELERSEQLTRSVLDAIAANVAVLDRDGTIIDVNQRWTRFARENDGDADAVGVGVNYLEVCTPAEAEGSSAIPAVREEIRAVVEGEKELFEYQYPCHGPDEERWFLLRATPLERDEGGAVVAHLNVTERVKAVREQRVLSTAVDQAQEAVLITEADAIDEPGPEIVYVNSAVEAMTGYPEEELLGQTPRMLQGPGTERAVLDSIREALEAGDEWRGETVNYRKDGTPYRVQWSLAPVRGEDGEIEYWVSVQRDVTEEREREDTLRRQRNLLDQTQKLAGAWEADLQTGEMLWSEEIYRIHEVPPGTQITTDEGIEFYAPEARPKIRKAFERCVEEGEPYDLELPIDTANGNRRWVRTVGAPSERKDGEIVKVAGAFQDITDRKEAERELAESEERYRTLAEHFPNGAVGVYDHDLRYSLAEGELLGTRLPSSDELEGDRMPDIFPESTASDLEPMFRAAVEEGVSGRRETTFGGRIWRVWATPLRGPEGEIFAGLSYAQDITEHKQREQALREQRNLLSQTQRLAGGWQVDLELGTVSWSEEVYRIHELPPGTEIGLDEAIAFFEAGAADELEEALDRCSEDGESYDLELPLTTAKGNRRWVRTVGAPSERKDGEIVKVAGALQDITERKEAERALREREAQLRGLANSIPGVVYQFYALPDGTYGNHFVSEHAQSMLGIAPETDDFFERVVERIPPAHRDDFLSSVDAAVEEEATWWHEFPYHHPSGETIWILGTSTPERRDGELIFNGVLLDVTERREAQEALEEREEYLSVMLQSIGDAVVATDRDGCVTEMNSVAEQLTGWRREEAEGRLLDDILTLHSARTGESVESPVEEVLQGGRTVGLANRTVLTSRDGREYQIANSAAPIRTEEEDLLGVVLVFRDVTEKYERRRRMERQNELFQKAQEIASVGAWEYDQQTETLTLTDQAYRVHGLDSGSDVVPERVHGLYHPEDRAEVEEAFQRALEEGESYNIEARLITEAGEERWVHTSGEPQIEDEEGSGEEVIRIRGAVQDITERKRRQTRLEEMHDRMELALDYTSSVVFEIDLETDQVSRIGAYEAFFGKTPEELDTREKHIHRAVHPDDRADFRAFYHELARGERTSGTIEYRTNPELGDVRWIRDNVHRIVDESRLLGLARDITERKNREQELAHQRALLEAQAEATIDGLLAVDDDRDVAFYNNRFLQIWNIPESAVEQNPVGKPLEDVLLDHITDLLDNPEEFREKAEDLSAHPEAESRDLVELSDGRWVDRYSAPIVRENKTPSGRLWVFRDVTERREREEQLREAKEEAERMNRLKSAFLANMSHEIRTPLTSIIGFAEIIGDEVDALGESDADLDLSVLRRYSVLIQKGGRRLMETLEDVLNLSKLEAGEMDLSSEPTDVVEAVTEIVEQFEPQAREAGVDAQADVPPETVRTHVDPEGLRIALRNLVNNAIKYTEQGGQMWVRVRPTEDTVLVEVEDTGIGMEPEQVPELFEAFVQESEGIGREYEGSGLGLTVTKEVVDQMGGSLDVTTEKGEGSCFTLRLPRVDG